MHIVASGKRLYHVDGLWKVPFASVRVSGNWLACRTWGRMCLMKLTSGSKATLGRL